MAGRHSATPTRTGVRWVVGAAGVAMAAGAVLLAASPAGASGDTVSAVFSVTGVSTSNCTVSTGGADVYIKPGDTLNVKSSLVGVTALGAAVNIAKVASIDGDLTIDPGTNHAKVLPISGTAKNITGLASGNHVFTWRADTVTLLGIKVPLKINTKLAAAGASLNYQGTIHVTSSAPKCGIAVQVPGPSASVSVTGLPPIKVSLPPLNVNVPVDPGQVIKPPTKTTTPPPGSGSSSGGLHYTPPPPTVPEEVVPKGSGGFLGGGGGYFGGALPDVSSGDVGPSVLAPAKTVPHVKVVKPNQNDVKKAKSPELAANKAPSAQMPVVLAIIAIIALAMVTATYARLYLLRRQ